MEHFSPAVELRLVMGSDRFNAQDDSWLEQERELIRALGNAGVPVKYDAVVGAPGTKGPLEILVMALTSAQATRSATECWRAWLARDDSRRIEVSRTVDGETYSVVLTASRVPEQELARLLREPGGRATDEDGPAA
ncbi:hypothetical protein ACIRQQ_21965 [Streptomyces fuscichromogenes]|uniref:hypothetical protein n=1 Tax=Streptomyces fuscichromogenes TaxID=1324013 RepID=UPI00381F9434